MKIALSSWHACLSSCLQSQVAIFSKEPGFMTFNSSPEIYATAGTRLPVQSTMVPVQPSWQPIVNCPFASFPPRKSLVLFLPGCHRNTRAFLIVWILLRTRSAGKKYVFQQKNTHTSHMKLFVQQQNQIVAHYVHQDTIWYSDYSDSQNIIWYPNSQRSSFISKIHY